MLGKHLLAALLQRLLSTSAMQDLLLGKRLPASMSSHVASILRTVFFQSLNNLFDRLPYLTFRVALDIVRLSNASLKSWLRLV